MKFNSGERDRRTRMKKTTRRKKGVQSTSKTPSRRSRPWGRRADDVPKEEEQAPFSPPDKKIGGQGTNA